ncbi:phosphomannomutase [Hasllibacter halocynthiae]|uniref:Phosphomannomutase n=2 Tax=Hasllibacter halocynthiae TaxID=595589 RepID=A0A2T0X1S9_9RHOB|nr:phosphomannomutase [Hasllibacter halocynthiae]PRY92814.1 phosphomannomutase [Hasllibacter halocynthiae]
MPPKFGTSGLRGLVADLTPSLVRAYVGAFLSTCPHGGTVLVGRDLRPSSLGIAEVVFSAVQAADLVAVDCGEVPTPALAQAALARGAAAVMVTGSHIPADRNGLKFYVPSGEISKANEARIVEAYAAGTVPNPGSGSFERDQTAGAAWCDRIVEAFGTRALAGLSIGIYRHSSVARDLLEDALSALGARAVPLGQSEVFVPVDTEAIELSTRQRLTAWCAEHRLDAIVSTDGDGDRPMLADSRGRIVSGDLLGVITARAVGAERIATPISSNDAVERMGLQVTRTRIGSPHVIAALEAAGGRCVGFEANGGFIMGFDGRGPEGPLPALMTRDALLPIVASLAIPGGLQTALAALPSRFTAARKVEEIDRPAGEALIAELDSDAEARSIFFGATGMIGNVDRTDGLRVVFEDGHAVHLRLSGNAPEFRVYAQADDADTADGLAAAYTDRVALRVRR